MLLSSNPHPRRVPGNRLDPFTASGRILLSRLHPTGLFDHNGVVLRCGSTQSLKEAGFMDAYRSQHATPVRHPGFTWPASIDCAESAGGRVWKGPLGAGRCAMANRPPRCAGQLHGYTARGWGCASERAIRRIMADRANRADVTTRGCSAGWAGRHDASIAQGFP